MTDDSSGSSPDPTKRKRRRRRGPKTGAGDSNSGGEARSEGAPASSGGGSDPGRAGGRSGARTSRRAQAGGVDRAGGGRGNERRGGGGGRGRSPEPSRATRYDTDEDQLDDTPAVLESAPGQPKIAIDESKAVPVDQCAFGEYELRPDLLKGLAATGYRTPSPIQARTLPHALEGEDVIGQARTGTGKTAAFLVPSLQMLTDKPGPRVLVVVPTRELAMQVAEEADRLSRFMDGVRTLAVYGGDPMKRQLDGLKRDPKVIAATPGRLLDHLSRGTIKLQELDMLVLDEADRMFDLGFREDIAKIISRAPGRRQTLLFSATMSDEVLDLSARYMNNPAQVFLAPDKMTVDEVDQSVFRVDPQFKTTLLVEVLKREQPDRSIIFTRTKIGADKLAMRLNKKGIEAHEIHSGLHQKKREKILQGFRDGEFNFLIATDVAARGIDIPEISHVINYDIPENPEDYVHRIGRTARMGKSGRAVTFVTGDDSVYLTAIEKLINQEVEPEHYDGIKTREAEAETAEAEPPKAASYTRTLQGHIRKRTRR